MAGDEQSNEKQEGQPMTGAAMEYVFQRLAELESRNEPEGAPALPEPPKSRKDRKHIMIWVNPFNQVRREVPDDYDGPEVVEAFKNYSRSRLLGRRV